MNIPSWLEVKTLCPKFAQALLREYKCRNGMVPYEQGYVYLIHATGSNFYKIGKSINPDKRLLQIAPKMPFDTEFARVWLSNFMSVAERMLHQWFAERRVNGEWFALCESDIEMMHCVFMARSVRHAYADVVAALLWQDQEESKRIPCFSDCVASDLGGAISIAIIESLFLEIEREQQAIAPHQVEVLA